MNVALTGGSGFVGRYLVDALLDAGRSPSLLVRTRSLRKLARVAECRIVTGDVRDEAALDRLAAGMDALIFNVGLLRESPGSSFEQLQWRCVEGQCGGVESPASFLPGAGSRLEPPHHRRRLARALHARHREPAGRFAPGLRASHDHRRGATASQLAHGISILYRSVGT